MLVEVFLNLGTNDFPDSPLTAGEHEVPDVLGASLVARRLAREIVTEKEPEQTFRAAADAPAEISVPETKQDKPAAKSPSVLKTKEK